MKGIMFNYLEEYVSENHGIDVWESILERCKLQSDKIFVGPGSYPDSDFQSLLNLTAASLKIDQEKFLKDFGTFMFRYLVRDYLVFLKGHSTPKSFLKTVDGIIHVEVKKLFSKATPPQFVYEDPSPEKLIIRYSSQRKLCHLMDGIIKGVSEHYHTPITAVQKTCILKGDKECTFDLTFPE